MKIAFITPEYITESNFSGGLANYLSRICRSLKELGHIPIVFVGTSHDGYIEHYGIPVYRVKTIFPFNNLLLKIPFLGHMIPIMRWIWQSWRLNRKIAELHKISSIDIIQYTSYTSTAFFRHSSIPSIVRISGIQDLINASYGNRSSITRTALHLMDIRAMKNADHIIGPSILISQKVQDMLGKPVSVIESPYLKPEVSYDDKLYSDLLSDKEYLLFFGSIGRLKGVHTIASIIYRLLEKHPCLYFIFIGKDMGYNSGTMMQHVWENAGHYRERVLHFGTMHQDQLFPIIQGAKAVVLPSLIDNLPNTCIEAMALGRVVIGTQGASFEQLIEDGVSGFLSRIGDERSLMESIEKALELTDVQRKAMGYMAMQRIEMLRPEVVVQQLIDLYETVIKEHHRDMSNLP